MKWKDQIAEGRVFELRSASKRYQPPCGLIVNSAPRHWGERFLVAVDAYGVVGNHLNAREHNPGISVESLRLEQFDSKRIARRRPDLERFDVEDLALIRSGIALDFTGRMHGYPEPDVPMAVACAWTVFWTPAHAPGDYRWLHCDLWRERDRLFRGAWYFDKYGGARNLGYKFGHCWGTRHVGRRLNGIRLFLYREFPDVIEIPVRVKSWSDQAGNIFTEEIRRECPPLGSRWGWIQKPNGDQYGAMLS